MLLLFDLDDTLYSRTEQLADNYRLDDLQKIKLFPGVSTLLKKKGITKVLVTKGTTEIQFPKIRALKIDSCFDRILVCSTDDAKKKCFEEALRQFPDSDVWVVGNRRDSEIRYGKELGLKTVLLRHGKYGVLVPKDAYEVPDYEIEQFADLAPLLGVK